MAANLHLEKLCYQQALSYEGRLSEIQKADNSGLFLQNFSKTTDNQRFQSKYGT